MVSIQLTEEEKLEVLFVAFCLFLVSAVASICLAASFCPLNRWLTDRQHRKRQRRLQQLQQPVYFAPNHHFAQNGHPGRHPASNIVGQTRHYHLNQRLYHTNFKDSLASYIGPPPAYEAALRATRLQSLTGSLYSNSNSNETSEQKLKDETEQNSWSNIKQQPILDQEGQLDFGDYFHQPRDAQAVNAELFAYNPLGHELASDRNKQPPVMLRLWVKVLEPGELVRRAKATRPPVESPQESSLTISKLSLSRQLSIPQFFNSFVGSGGGGGSITNKMDSQDTKPAAATITTNIDAQQHSLESTSSSELEQSNIRQAASIREEEKSKAEVLNSKRKNSTRRNSRLLNSTSSITSRVLHMNVASFSYVKDETLISTKKHNQLNYQDFCSQNGSADKIASQKVRDSRSKFCQLLISICDIENVLNSSWLNEKSCALLANNSSIYIQCELLLPKSKSAHLLSPLRGVLQNYHTNGEDQNNKHTINFGSSISAAAVERTQASGSTSITIHTNRPDESITTTTEESMRSTSSSSGGQQETNAASKEQKVRSTNWRHEPSADGRSIVVFSSIPKSIAHQQQLTASVSGQVSLNSSLSSYQSPAPDLIQFDSVFVSPILQKSTIEDGYIRFRIYSQCKYVNETCLAELKLPLKQLLLSETNDNLSDIGHGIKSPDQSDLILDNLLRNLVTASTGSPLSSLIEQISSEEREAKALEVYNSLADHLEQASANKSTLKSMLHLWSFSPGVVRTQSSAASENLNCPPKGLRGSCSFNESLHRLTNQYDTTNSKLAENFHQIDEQEKRLEQNYCRSLMVSHWLNYLVAPSYECQLIDESRGKIIISLSYLPTSNRVIFNAHRATINDDSYASGKYLMKNLRLQSSTCYLLRFLMVINGRVVKRKQTPATRKPEWDSQEPITFDLVSVSVEQPSFIVALVMRNLAIPPPSLAGGTTTTNSSSVNQFTTGSLQNLKGSSRLYQQPTMISNQQAAGRQQSSKTMGDCQSEPEYGSAVYQQHRQHQAGGPGHVISASSHERDLVIGHLVLSDEIWREMKAQPRKQIVRQFKMY